VAALPYPEPTDVHVTKRMRANRRTNTRPEVALRSHLHSAGLRFRKDHLVVAGNLKVRPDIVFTRHRLAVFVDGCFWHCCPDHGTVPGRNVDYWVPKLARNVERDRVTTEGLEAHGWRVIRVWEHEALAEAHSRVAIALQGT
jgi:DNA mismatch endonuclease (patch repair protein)